MRTILLSEPLPLVVHAALSVTGAAAAGCELSVAVWAAVELEPSVAELVADWPSAGCAAGL
jgi:hypothetical protein